MPYKEKEERYQRSEESILKEPDENCQRPVHTTTIDGKRFRPVSVIDPGEPGRTQRSAEEKGVEFRIVPAEGWTIEGRPIDPTKAIILIDHEATKDGW